MRTLIWLLLLGLSLLGCTRSIDPEKTVINLRMPSELRLAAKADIMAALPSGRKLCYAVNVTGPGIDNAGDQCGVSRGLMLGFVESGNSVAVEIKPGADRRIALYAYLMGHGETGTCPAIPPSFKDLGVKNMFKVAESEAINISGDEMVVNLQATFPGMNQSFAHTMTLPESCIPIDPTEVARKSPRSSSGGGVVQSANLRLRSRIGTSASASRIESGQVRLHQ